MKLVIIGSAGQLGTELTQVLVPTCELVALTRRELDITDVDRVTDTIARIRPDAIVNAAAYTDVDGAESNPRAAFAVNADGARNVAAAARRVGAKLVHVSTDYVFDGRKGSPYNEADRPSPINVYGESKLQGELFVRQLCERAFIVRTSWLFGAGGRNFVKMIHSMARRQSHLKAPYDTVGSPTYAPDLAAFIGRLLRTERYGLYHAANRGFCSRFELAQAVLEATGRSDVTLSAVPSSEFRLPAERPLHSALDCAAIRDSGLPALRHWKEALHDFIAADPFFREGEPDAERTTTGDLS